MLITLTFLREKKNVSTFFMFRHLNILSSPRRVGKQEIERRNIYISASVLTSSYSFTFVRYVCLPFLNAMAKRKREKESETTKNKM